MNVVLPLFEPLGRYLILWSWQLTIVVCLIALVAVLDRRHRADFRHRLWMLALLLTLSLPWAPQLIASFTFTKQVKQIWMDPFAESLPEAKPGIGVSAPAVRGGHFGQAGELTFSTGPDASGALAFVRSSVLLGSIGFLWFAGILVCAVRVTGGRLRLRRMVAAARPVAAHEIAPGITETGPPEVRLSRQVHGPMLCGWVRPVILLPENIGQWSTAGERALILQHEYLHYLRRDHWVSGLEALARAALFFHPVALWMCRQLDQEREIACDRELLTGIDPSPYAETLLKVAEHAVGESSGMPFTSARRLERRMELLFSSCRRVPPVALATFSLFIYGMPLVGLGFRQSHLERTGQIESSFSLALLPTPPPSAFARIGTKPEPSTVPVAVPAPPQQSPANPVSPQPASLKAHVTVLKGRGIANEVRVTLSVPYSSLTFANDRTGTAAMGIFEITVSYLSGRTANHVEEPFSVMLARPELLSAGGAAIMQEPMLLSPGLYRLTAVVTDSATGQTQRLERRLEIPALAAKSLSASSLVLADFIEDRQDSGSNWFAIDNVRVRPNVTGKFQQSQSLHIFQQYYNPIRNGQTFPDELSLETLITLDGRELRRFSQSLDQSVEVTATRTIPLSDFAPGDYSVQTTVTDKASGEMVVSKAEFNVD